MTSNNHGLGNITWLASYPKSGNTWLRIFLSYILSGNPDKFDINHLLIQGIASSRILFDRYTGLDSCNLNADEIDKLRPEVYCYLSNHVPKHHYCKTHDAYRNTINQQALFPKQASKQVIYIIRNPLDVAVSYKYHMGYEDISAVAKDICDPAGGLALSTHSMPGQLIQHMGSWSEHILSWTTQTHIPITVIRYEDMLLDSLNTFRHLLQTLNIAKTDTEIQQAIEATNFQKLQQQEMSQGFLGKPALTPRFFRNGQIGNWKNELKQPDTNHIINGNSQVMRQFGYIDADNNPIFNHYFRNTYDNATQ